MAMTYSTLTGAMTADGSIRQLVVNPNLDVEGILEDAQTRIYDELRVREMEELATLTATIGVRTIDLPADFLDPITLKDRYYKDMKMWDFDALAQTWANDTDGNPEQSEPSFYAIFGTKIYFNVALDAAYTFTLAYNKKPALLAAGNQTNFLTNRYPHLLRAACRHYAYVFLKNWETAKVSEGHMVAALARIKTNDDLRYRGFAPPERE